MNLDIRFSYIDIAIALTFSLGSICAQVNINPQTSPPTMVSFTSFDVPGAGVTRPIAISPSGVIAGIYSTGSTHGFVRTTQGHISTIDPPGSFATNVTGINPRGTITGYFRDSAGQHGFVRDRDGQITTFDIPGGIDVVASGINPADVVTGSFRTSAGEHGFVRDEHGSITTFDIPGALNTVATSINASGTVAGYYQTTTGPRGFIRSTTAAVTTFGPPSESWGWVNYSPRDLFVTGINNKGDVSGYFGDVPFTTGFVRHPDGVFDGFHPGGGWYIVVKAINASGVIVGFSGDGKNYSEGFVGDAFTNVTLFGYPNDVPPQLRAARFTIPESINASGTIIGFYAKGLGQNASGFVITTANGSDRDD